MEGGSGRGGSAASLRNLLKSLDPERYTALVAVYNNYDPCRAALFTCRVFRLRSVNPYRWQSLDRGGWKGIYSTLWLLTVLLPAVAGLVAIIRRHKITIVHNNNDIYGNLAGILAAKVCGLRTVQHIRAQRSLTRIEKWCAGRVERFVFPLEATRSFYPEIPGARGCVLYDTVDPAEGEVRAAALQSLEREIDPRGRKLLLYAGSLRREKGIEFMLEALAQMAAPAFKLVIAGTTLEGQAEYEPELKAKVAALGMEHNVVFLGFFENVYCLIALCEVVIFPTFLEEGFGRPLIEAGIMGKPVLATDKPSLRELMAITEGGLLFAEGDRQDFTRKLQGLLQAGERKTSFSPERTRALTRRHFKAGSQREALTGIYESLTVSQ